MNDAAVRDLARRAGIALRWTDHANKRQRVPLDTAKHILDALGLPCGTTDDLSHSLRELGEVRTPPLITATAGQAVDVPINTLDATPDICLIRDDGGINRLTGHRSSRGITLPGFDTIGYHSLQVGQARITLAVAPPRCVTVEDIAPGERIGGLAAQIYGLRSAGDCGIGDMAGVVGLASAAAALKVDALALSPAHALFAADPDHFSPYSPSSRLFYNALFADATSLFGHERVAKARMNAGLGSSEHEAVPLIDWPSSSAAKMSVFRYLFDDFAATDLAGRPTDLAADFEQFRASRQSALEEHALFEALHGARLQADPRAWNWKDWSPEWHDPHGANVRSFAERNQREILFHIFLQWLADRSFATAQRQSTQAGMRIGLIADLAVGMNSGGSHAWANQSDILRDLEIGAPPDLFNVYGQSWGLTTFSPRALMLGGFSQFIATLRACMQHAGGVRIDHAMGLMRLWIIPSGAKASEGAYLAYPLDDLLRLTALESYRHRAIVIGEDLGTVPAGFRNRLARTGIYGMSVLWFERDRNGFMPPQDWPTQTAAMTSTHDLPTMTGWWTGHDLDVRAAAGFLSDRKSEQAARNKDREVLWNALKSADVATGDLPAATDAASVDDAAVKFIAKSPSRLALLPLEDALALTEQPNLPGTIDEHPNWRRRYDGGAAELLDAPDVHRRIATLTQRDKA